jgi:hypothetical protein
MNSAMSLQIYIDKNLVIAYSGKLESAEASKENGGILLLHISKDKLSGLIQPGMNCRMKFPGNIFYSGSILSMDDMGAVCRLECRLIKDIVVPARENGIHALKAADSLT